MTINNHGQCREDSIVRNVIQNHSNRWIPQNIMSGGSPKSHGKKLGGKCSITPFSHSKNKPVAMGKLANKKLSNRRDMC